MDSQQLQLAMKRRSVHSNEFRCATDVSIKTAEVEGEIILLEFLARISQRHIHYLHRPSSDTAVAGFLPNSIADIGATCSFTLPIRRF